MGSLPAKHKLWGVWASVVVTGGLSRRGSWALEHGLISCGCASLVAMWHVGSFWISEQTHFYCTGRWLPYPRATREALRCTVLNDIKYFLFISIKRLYLTRVDPPLPTENTGLLLLLLPYSLVSPRKLKDVKIKFHNRNFSVFQDHINLFLEIVQVLRTSKTF